MDFFNGPNLNEIWNNLTVFNVFFFFSDCKNRAGKILTLISTRTVLLIVLLFFKILSTWDGAKGRGNDTVFAVYVFLQ